MKLIEDLGMKYPTKNSKQKKRFGLFLCKCGREVEMQIHNKPKNCKQCSASIAKTKHGDRANKSRLYKIWCGMKSRCYNKRNKAYKYYGEIGIKVCEEWKNNYISFKKWALNNGYSDSLDIDKDKLSRNSKIYSPETCMWVTRRENTKERNIRRNKNKVIGIRKTKNKNKFQAYIKTNGVVKHLGIFNNIDNAINFRNKYIEDNNLTNIRSKI